MSKEDEQAIQMDEKDTEINGLKSEINRLSGIIQQQELVIVGFAKLAMRVQ